MLGSQIEIIATDRAYPMDRPLPLNYSAKDVDLIDGDKSFTIPDLNIYKIKNAKLYEDGSIFTDEGFSSLQFETKECCPSISGGQ